MKSLLVALAFSVPLLAWPSLAETVVPRPRLRPAAAPAQDAAAARPEGLAKPAAPLPRLRPAGNRAAAAPEAPVPAEVPPKPTARPSPEPSTQTAAPPAKEKAPSRPGGTGGWPPAAVAEAREACQRLLAGLSIDYETLGPLGEEGGCGAPAPVLVSRVAGVALTPPATLTCDMAAALHAWVSGEMKSAARNRLGTDVTEIHTATSYACRRRNNASSGKMSEHSKANALDMSGFSFARKTNVSVGSSGSWGADMMGSLGVSKSGSFLEEVRKDACTHFTTVLGPGSDPYHGDHFHVDVLRRKGDYRICQ